MESPRNFFHHKILSKSWKVCLEILIYDKNAGLRCSSNETCVNRERERNWRKRDFRVWIEIPENVENDSRTTTLGWTWFAGRQSGKIRLKTFLIQIQSLEVFMMFYFPCFSSWTDSENGTIKHLLKTTFHVQKSFYIGLNFKIILIKTLIWFRNIIRRFWTAMVWNDLETVEINFVDGKRNKKWCD